MLANEIIFKAAKTASILHKDQTRRDGSPYIDHPFAVAFLVSEFSKDPEVIAAALLHDIIEDVSKEIYSEQQMQDDFGIRVHALVKSLSDKNDPASDAEKRLTWKDRKTKYLKSLETMDRDALLISCADKTHNIYDLVRNLKEIGPTFWDTFHANKDYKFWYLKSCVTIFNKKLNSHETNLLNKYYNELESLL